MSRLLRPAIWLAACWACLAPVGRAQTAGDSGLAQAWDELGLLNFSAAARAFESIRQVEKTGAEPWLKATLGLALCRHHAMPCTRAGIEQASRLYAEMMVAAPDTAYAAQALYNLARIDHLEDYFGDAGDRPAAKTKYLQIIARWPDELVASQAAFHLVELYAEDDSPEERQRAWEFLDAWLDGHPACPLRSAMLHYAACAALESDRDYRRLVDFLRREEQAGWAVPALAGENYWRIARSADLHLNDRPLAIEYYNRLITRAPAYNKVYQARVRVGELGGIPAAAPEPAGAGPCGDGQQP